MRVGQTVVIVGASVAGGTAAATLREEGYDGRLVLVGAEELPPYERPPLSKEVLRGEEPAASAFLRPVWTGCSTCVRSGTQRGSRRLRAPGVTRSWSAWGSSGQRSRRRFARWAWE